MRASRSRSSAASRWTARGSGAASSRSCRAALPGGDSPVTCSPGCVRPACSSAPISPTASSARSACAACATSRPPRRHGRRSTPASRCTSSSGCAPRPRAATSRPCATRWPPRRSALFAAPWRGTGAVLSGPPAADARALRALRRLLRELADVARRDPALAPEPSELPDLLRGRRSGSAPRRTPGR